MSAEQFRTVVQVISAWVVLTGICLTAGAALVLRSLVAVVMLSALCAFWLPYNNGRLEGPILISVGAGHGLTVMDLVSYTGLAVALGVCVVSRRKRLRLPVAAVCCLTVGAGLAAAFFVWSGPMVRPSAPHSGPGPSAPAHRSGSLQGVTRRRYDRHTPGPLLEPGLFVLSTSGPSIA